MTNCEAIFISYLEAYGVNATKDNYLALSSLSKETFSDTYDYLVSNKGMSVFVQSITSLTLVPTILKEVKFFCAVLDLKTLFTETELLKSNKANTLYIVPIDKESLNIDNIDKTRYNINLYSWCKMRIKFVLVDLTERDIKIAKDLINADMGC